MGDVGDECTLSFYPISLLKALHPPHSVNYPLFTGVKRVAFTAYLDSELWLGGANGKGITAKAGYFGIIIIFGVNFSFHYKHSPSFYI